MSDIVPIKLTLTLEHDTINGRKEITMCAAIIFGIWQDSIAAGVFAFIALDMFGR